MKLLAKTFYSYLPKGQAATADFRNMIQCNEAMLVDSMIPLDKVMVSHKLDAVKALALTTFASSDPLVKAS